MAGAGPREPAPEQDRRNGRKPYGKQAEGSRPAQPGKKKFRRNRNRRKAA